MNFEVGLLRDLDHDDLDALLQAADRYGRFLGLEASLTLEPDGSSGR